MRDNNTKINHISLCTGYGGIDLGLKRVVRNLRTVAYCEIEAFVCANLVSKMEAGLMDPAPIWTNLKRFPFEGFHGKVDILSGGYPCFRAGTIICTYRGFIPIEQVVVGDMVLTHLGRWRRVTSTMFKSGAPVRRIKAQGVPGVVCTDEHPFYTQEGWKDARDIARGDRVGQVLPEVIENDRSLEFWWVIGRYLADGWRQKPPTQSCGRITICCNHKEADFLQDKISAAGFNSYKNKERTATRFAITNKELYEFCGQFGSGAAGKHLPGWIIGLDPERAKSLCHGYFSGDGSRPKKSDDHWRVTTVSRGLAVSFALLAQRAFGVVASVREQNVKPKTIIEGRTVNQRMQYALAVPDRNRSGRIEGSYGWKYVRNNEPCGVADVYNIAVEEDESYCADGAIVHNCQPFSAAGSRKGKDDPRHLWPWIAEGIKNCQPKLCLFENVEGHISLGLSTVISDLEELGYKVSWGIFSASEVGAPHQRKRVFILAGRSEWLANAPHQLSHWAGATGQSGRSEPSDIGCVMADSPCDGRKQGRSQSKGRKGRPEVELVGEDVAHSDGSGLEGQSGDVDIIQESGRITQGQDRPSSPHGLCTWPTGPSQQQHWWEPPRTIRKPERRTAKPKVGGDPDGLARRMDDAELYASLDNRQDELRMLGNGVVPAVAEKAFRILLGELIQADFQ